jgi:serine/threonine protein kinase/Tol biopolymer transport system component
MNPKRWQEIERLYHEALARDADERSEFLRQACGGDDDVRQEVESLLSQATAADRLLSGRGAGPHDQLVRRAFADTELPGTSDPTAGVGTLAGHTIGPYRLHSLIGAGGMGEVYRARDTRLGRDVAVKIVSQKFAADPDRLARFEREARVLASLNHPNIATIHGIEDGGGIRALVMELVEGETLADRLMRGAMPAAEALAVARQLADALDAAHDKGIIHRDLKPANISVSSTGVVKVLDFGLAKAVRGESAADLSQTPTITRDATREGLIVGTAAYMSPEQARGQSVDKRTDIWAFGCVLYEMLTRRAAFARETISDTIAAILNSEPDWRAISGAPSAVGKLLRRCLIKEPARRLRDIGDARLEIDEILAGLSASSSAGSETAPSGHVRTSSIGRWVVTGAALIVAGLVGAATARLFLGGGSSAERPAQFTLSFAGQKADVADATVPMPSPDGRQFVFVAANEAGTTSLWIRPLDSAEARPLTGTDGGQTPIWSPDGQWVAFYADGKLKKVRVDGGLPQTIATLRGFQQAAWGSAGEIIFRARNREPLFRVSASGGTPAPLTQLNAALEENSHRGPTFLPDGRRFLFTSRSAAPENNALYIGSLDSSDVRRVMSLASKAVYVASRNGGPGTLIYYRDGGLEAHAFDPDRGELIGEPQPIIGDVEYNAAGIVAFFEVSADGRVIVVRPAGAGDRQFTWFERNGDQTGTLGGPGDIYQPRLSAQGDRVAFTRPDAQNGNRDVWTMTVPRGGATRLTVDPSNDWHAVWSSDGKRIAFASDRDGPVERLFVKPSNDAGGADSAMGTATGALSDWSRDGRWIAFGSPVSIVSASADSQAFRFLATPFWNGSARFSPDSKWIAYTSNETGGYEVFVRPFAGAPATAEGSIRISDSGGDYPVWRSDGQELYYMSEDLTIYAVATTDLHANGIAPRPQTLFRACPETVPFQRPMRGTPWGHPFDTLDGKRFLVNCQANPSGQFVVLMNWSPAADR